MRLSRTVRNRSLVALVALSLLFANLAQAATFIVPQGGTGRSSFTSNAIIKGNGTGALGISGVSIDSSNNVTGVADLTITGECTGCAKSEGIYTLGPTGSGADYVFNGSDDQVEIEAALLACSNDANCGTVKQLPGTAIISDLVQVPTNVHWIGSGIDQTIVKAVNNYTPATQTVMQGGGTQTTHTLVQNLTDEYHNVTISGITFDGNGQNKAGLTSNSNHRNVNFTSLTNTSTNLRIIGNKFINSINYNLWVSGAQYVWIEDNIVFGGWSSTYDQQDGYHLRAVQDFWIVNNFCNTTDATNGGTGGDDCIAVGSGELVAVNEETSRGVISGNVISSGTNAIRLLNDSDDDTRDIVISNNTIPTGEGNGIIISYYPESTGENCDGIFRNIVIDGNTITDIGLANNTRAAIRSENNGAVPCVTIVNAAITNNTYTGATSLTTTKAVNWDNKTVGLNMSNNMFTLVGLTTAAVDLGGNQNPLKDVVMTGNVVDNTLAGNDSICYVLYGSERSTFAGNICKGNTGGTSEGLRLTEDDTAGNDPAGIPNVETSAYNNVTGNTFLNVDLGVREVSAGTNPDDNTFTNNTFIGVTTSYTLLGSSSATFDYNGTNFVATKALTVSRDSASALFLGTNTNADAGVNLNGRAFFGYDSASGNAFVQGGSTKGIEFNVNNATPGSGTVMTIDSTDVSTTLAINPETNDGAALGTSSLKWSDLFVASGGVVNFNGGESTLTHSGTGTLTIVGAGTGLTVGNSTQAILGNRNNTSVSLMTLTSTGLTASSGSQWGLKIDPTVNQSSTAGYAMLLVNPTESATGSGAKLLADFQVGGASQLSLTNKGHVTSGGTAPAASSCGTSPSVTATSTDTAGKVTMGTGGPTSCTLTFANAYASAPACTITGDQASVTYAATTTTSTLVITSSADMSSDVIMYLCFEHA